MAAKCSVYQGTTREWGIRGGVVEGWVHRWTGLQEKVNSDRFKSNQTIVIPSLCWCSDGWTKEKLSKKMLCKIYRSVNLEKEERQFCILKFHKNTISLFTSKAEFFLSQSISASIAWVFPKSFWYMFKTACNSGVITLWGWPEFLLTGNGSRFTSYLL